MIAKLCVWGLSRKAALARMTRALREFAVTGIKTNIRFHQKVLDTQQFLSGEYDTGWLEREFMPKYKDSVTGSLKDASFRAALIASAIDSYVKERDGLHRLKVNTGPLSSWRIKGRWKGVTG
jgi:acetyl-CoA carboxylase biotin carboxylase subunit